MRVEYVVAVGVARADVLRALGAVATPAPSGNAPQRLVCGRCGTGMLDVTTITDRRPRLVCGNGRCATAVSAGE